MKKNKDDKRLKTLLDAIKKERGYSLPSWTYIAEKDIDFMETYNNLYMKGLMAGKALPVKTKELVAIALLASQRSEDGAYGHMKRALRYGATKQEILETMEATLIVCGAATFALGLRALIRIEKDEEEERKGNTVK